MVTVEVNTTTNVIEVLGEERVIDVTIASFADLAQAVAEAQAAALASEADAVLTSADAAATAADRVQTGLDATATAADAVQTNLDRIAAAASASDAAASAATVNPALFLAKADNLSGLENTATAIANLGITATATELNYTDGVSSPIQTQLDGKIATGPAPAIVTGDMDDLTEGNIYNYQGALANTPTASAGVLFVGDRMFGGAFQGVTQIAMPFDFGGNTTEMYIRAGTGDPVAFSDWARVFTNAGTYESAEISIPAGGAAITPLSHGLGAKPFLVTAEIICKTANHGYAVGDTVVLSNTANATNTTNYGLGVAYNDTEIKATIPSNGIAVVRLSDGTYQVITTASWRLVFKAWAA